MQQGVSSIDEVYGENEKPTVIEYELGIYEVNGVQLPRQRQIVDDVYPFPSLHSSAGERRT